MIFIANDHFGVATANQVRSFCDLRGIEHVSSGSNNPDDLVTLESLIPPFVESVRSTTDSTGVLICGTGVGVEIGANKFKGIRASLCISAQLAEWSRVYDNANVLCLPGWDMSADTLQEVLAAWTSSQFDGDEGRTKMLTVFDDWLGN